MNARHVTGRRRQALGFALAMAVLVAACGGAGEDDAATEDTATEESTASEEESASEETEAAAGGGDLASVCPATVVLQLDWEPESEHGGVYQLLGDDYEIDTDAKRVSGPLVSGGEETGVDVEIRVGGSPVGYQPAESLMYQDTDILLGYARVAEMTATREDLPLTAVMATLEKSPFAIYWDPQTYPDAQSIADLQADDVTILMGSGSEVWKTFLVAEGIIAESQIDSSDAEKPAAFIAAGGSLAEAGFATAEPYLYEVEVADEWGRPVEVELIHDAGFPEYFQALAVRAEDVEAQAPCLEQLVPILQQAQVDYVTDPAATNARIVELVEAYNTGWIYTEGAAQFSIDTQIELGIVGNGEDDTLGNFDEARVEELRTIVDEVTDIDVSGYAAEDLATNAFIDPAIGVSG